MSFLIFLKVFSVCLLGAISPGPSMVVVINNAIFKNRYHGFLTSLGHGIGITIYALFAVLGIGLILTTNMILFNGLKILSIIFLFYLGVKSIFSKKNIDFKSKNIKGGATSFFQGLSISMLNPKIFIWFIAIFSQFISVNNNLIFNIYLVITAGIVDFSWYILLTLVVTSGTSLRFIKNKSFIIQKIQGVLFILISLLLILDVTR